MAIGERIRWFRKRLNLTQKELGIKIGLNKLTAETRIGQYETGQRKPKPDMINDMAEALGVSSEAIAVPDIDSYIGLMHTLFTLEDRYGLTVTNLDGQVCLKLDVNNPNYDLGVASDLDAWNKVKTKLTTGSMLLSEYDHWRYNYPEDKTKETREELDSLRGKKNK